MSPEICEQHQRLAEDIAVIKNDLIYIKDKVCRHIQEGETPGTGYRDRVLSLEIAVRSVVEDISTMRDKKDYWIAGAIGGIVGGFLSQATPELFKMVIDLLR